MVKVVSWNIGKREQPWRELVQMARDGAADVALLQEAGSPPGDVVDRIEYVDRVFWEAVRSHHRRAVPTGPTNQRPR